MTPKPKTRSYGEAKLRDELAAKMSSVTLASLPRFIQSALKRGGTGYGEICVALGAIAAAAAKAADRSPQGGITGFQAGAVFWEFTKHWGVFGVGPKRIQTFHDMLYPQYEDKFAKTISQDTWKYLQAEATRLLTQDHEHASANVVAHWKCIAAGHVPFGYEVTDND